MEGDSKQYIKMLVFVFIALGSFIIAILGAYFGGVGLYFGQGVVEGDVWADYKYVCANASESQSECTAFNTSQQTASFQDYEEFRADINATLPRYINATTIVFSLLGLVFLFLALKSSGLWGKKSKREEI